jgi:hypothetical protein
MPRVSPGRLDRQGEAEPEVDLAELAKISHALGFQPPGLSADCAVKCPDFVKGVHLTGVLRMAFVLLE